VTHSLFRRAARKLFRRSAGDRGRKECITLSVTLSEREAEIEKVARILLGCHGDLARAADRKRHQALELAAVSGPHSLRKMRKSDTHSFGAQHADCQAKRRAIVIENECVSPFTLPVLLGRFGLARGQRCRVRSNGLAACWGDLIFSLTREGWKPGAMLSVLAIWFSASTPPRTMSRASRRPLWLARPILSQQ
jgi:hypothetical protein